MMKKIAIVLSAGKGRRMGADIAKQYMEVNGHVILWYTLEAFIKSKVDEIVLVISKEDEESVHLLIPYEFLEGESVLKIN